MRKMLAVLLFDCAFVAYGSDARPNFTGNWTLNTDKSDFGPLQAPKSATVKVQYREPNLKIEFRQDGTTAALVCTTDGNQQKQCAGPVLGIALPITVTSKVAWDSSELTFLSEGDFNGGHVQVRDRWVLSQDGKTVTIHRHGASSTDGGTDQTIVLEKQP
jgi:hypothetical protein